MRLLHLLLAAIFWGCALTVQAGTVEFDAPETTRLNSNIAAKNEIRIFDVVVEFAETGKLAPLADQTPAEQGLDARPVAKAITLPPGPSIEPPLAEPPRLTDDMPLMAAGALVLLGLVGVATLGRRSA